MFATEAVLSPLGTISNTHYSPRHYTYHRTRSVAELCVLFQPLMMVRVRGWWLVVELWVVDLLLAGGRRVRARFVRSNSISNNPTLLVRTHLRDICEFFVENECSTEHVT